MKKRSYQYWTQMLLGVGLLIAAIPLAVDAQSRTGVLLYNDKGEVIGVIEENPVKSGRPATRKGTPTLRQLRNVPLAPEESYEPGEVIVVDPPSGFLAAMRREGYALIERITLETLGISVLRLRTPAGVEVEDAVRAIEQRFPSVRTGPNQRFTLSAGAPGDYARDMVGWGAVSARCGEGLRIGMIDTVVDVRHPALIGQRISRRSFVGKGSKPGRSDHGTAVAALLVGKADGGEWTGLLPGATLYAANIFAARKDGGLRASLASMMKALEWLAAKQVRIVNFSLAGSFNKVLAKLMERASARGMALVAAAGNGGAAAKPAYPAAHPKVLAVTAIDQRRAVYDYANRGDYIDFAAPGVQLWTATRDGGGLQSGTSFAAPFVTGAVALQIANGLKPEPQRLRDALRRFTKDLGAPGRDAIFGWGLVRIRPDC